MRNSGFSLGDVVALKSSSPDLTVVGVIEGGKSYNVAWFDGTKDHVSNYPGEALELASERDERHRRQSAEQTRKTQEAFAELGRRYHG